MSWEPNTEENETRKTRDNLEDLKQAQFFNTSSINSSSITNSMGTSSNMSGFSFDVMGDIVEGITNTFVGGLGELYKILSGYVFITPDASEPNDTAVINKIGNGTGNTVDKANLPQDGQLLTLRPEAGKSLTLINNVKTGLSSAGNLLLGSDITLTESESITLRYQNEIKYADAINGVSENIGGWIVHSTGGGLASTNINSLKDPVKVATTGNNAVHPAWGSTIDGIGMVVGDRFLVKDQSNPNEKDNGIYIWGTGALGVSVRSSDMSDGSVQKEGTMTYVQDGLTQNERLYAINIGGNNITIGTNPNTWGEIGSGSGGGSGAIKSPVKYATTADVTSWTYNNTSGTLTASGNGVVVIDGITLAVNNRILVKDQSPANENGIYSVTTAGAVGATLVLTRSTDMSTGSTIEGGTMVYVTDGTVNGDNLFGLTTEGTVTVGTGNQAWANLTGGGANQTLSNLTSPTSVNQDLVMQNGFAITNVDGVYFNTRITTPAIPAITYDGTDIFAKGSGAEVNLTSTTNNWSDITIDVNKDMNNKQLTNLNAVVSTSNVTATGFIFNTSSGNPSKITSSATSDIMGFMVDGVEKGSFAKDGTLDTIFEVAGNPSPMMKFSSTATGANRVIGTIQFDGLDLTPSRQTYGLIYGWSRNVGASSKEGELQFNVMKSNVSTGIMKMDGTGLLPYADNSSVLGSASLGWSEIRSKGSVYGSQYYFVTSSGTAPRITSSANSTVMGLWVDGFESASVTYDTFGGNKDGELAINGSSAIGARFRMYNSATPSGGSTTAGRMYFDAKDSAGNADTFAMIEAGATNYTSGSEQGEIDFQVRRGGTNTESVAIINQTGFHPPINNSQNYNLGSTSTPWNVVYAETFHAITTNTPALIELYRDNTVLGDNEMGRIIWYGDRTGVNKDPLAWIRTNILDYTQGDAYMGLDIAVNGSQDTFIELYGDDPKIRLHKPADLVRQAVPSDPASNATGKLFYNSVDNHLSFRKRNDANTAFETVDLEGAGGGSQTPWTSTIDANNNPLIGANYIQFNNLNQAVNPANTVPFIQFDNLDMIFNIPTGKGYEVNINGDTLIGLSGSLAVFNSLGSMILKSNTNNTIQMFAGSTSATHTFQDNALSLGTGIDLVVSGNLIDFTNRATPTAGSIFGNGAMYSKGGDPMWWDGTTETSMLGGGSSGGGVNNSWIWTDDETNEFDEAIYLSNAVMGRDTQTTNAVLPYKDTVYWVPIYFSKACTINAIGLQFTTAGTGSMGLMYGLYDTYADQNYPKSLVDGGSSVGYMGTGLGGNYCLTTSFAVPSAGLYFIAIKNDTNTGSAFRVQGGGSTSPTPSLGHYYVSGTSNGFMPITGYYSTEYGNLPSTAQIDDDMSVTYYGGTNIPLIFVRVS